MQFYIQPRLTFHEIYEIRVVKRFMTPLRQLFFNFYEVNSDFLTGTKKNMILRAVRTKLLLKWNMYSSKEIRFLN